MKTPGKEPPWRHHQPSQPLMGHIRRLAGSAAYRWETGEFLCDSPKLLQEAPAVAGGDHRRGDHLPLPRLPEHIRQVQVPEDVMASISPVKTPQGVLFTCRLPQAPPAPVPHRPAVCAAGRGAGPRQRRHHPADAGRLRRRRPAAHRRLRRPLRLEGGALVHGGRVPPPHLFRHRRNWRPCCTAAASPCTGPPCGRTPWTPGRWTTPAARWPSAARAVA